MKGKIIQIYENATLEWCIKHCYFVNDEQRQNFINEYKTHSVVLHCGFCDSIPFINRYNIGDNIKCCICKKDNEVC